MEIIAESAELAFHKILNALEMHGIESSPRGMKIKEVINCCVTIKNPRDRIISCPERKISMSYAFGELCWYLSGRNDLKMMKYYSKFMERGTDDGKTLNSAYGYRIFTGKHPLIPFNQWENVKRLLKNDHDTRQAIIHLHTPNNKKTNDEVCTLNLQFLIRDNKLNMITTMRSNDVVLGFTYDVFAFTMLQEIMANELNVEVGTYYHNVGSMHIYENKFALLEKHTVSNLAPMEKFDWELKDFAEMIDFENECRCSKDIHEQYLLKKFTMVDDHLMKFAMAAFLLKMYKNNNDFHMQSNVINEVRLLNENYADVLQYSGSFSKKSNKVVICGIDGAGKTTLANDIAIDESCFLQYQIQHYSKPTNNFGFFANYLYNLQSDCDIIFDRFFISEIVYSKIFRKDKNERLSHEDVQELFDIAKEKNVKFIFVLALNQRHFYIVKSRLKEEDKNLVDYLMQMNNEYCKIANKMKESGFDVRIVGIGEE